MRRYLITGEAGAVNTVGDILANEDGYRWDVITDDGSSPAALLDLVRVMREWQKTFPWSTIAFCFPGLTPTAEVVQEWDGIPWVCATYHEDQPCGIRQGNLLQLAPTWGEAVEYLLAVPV